MEKEIYLLLTRLTVVAHLAFILFVLVGGFFVQRKGWLIAIHLIAITWAVYVELTPGLICPLTDLENYFGYRAGLATYSEDFITRYLIPIIYPENLTATFQLVLAGVVVGINVFAYRSKWVKVFRH